jgi:hypothetical protein
MARVVRPCDVCGQSDDHPRHQTQDVITHESRLAHFDCCAAQGCPQCAQDLASAPKDARHGAALVAHREELVTRLTKEGQA